MAFLPSFAWQQKGFDDEQDKSRRLRSENRKALQEISDRAAEQGQELGVDEWFSMVNEQLGSDGFLNNYAPANTVLEGMRKTSNAKAMQVQRDQKFTAVKRSAEEDRLISENVLEMSRSGEPPEVISAKIAELYGPEMSARFAPKIGGIIQKASLADMTEGIRLGGQFNSVKEATDFADKNPQVTKSVREALINTAKKNEEKLRDDDWTVYQKVISALPGDAYQDSEDMRAIIKANLPPRMKADSDRHVSEAMEAWKGISMGTRRVREVGYDDMEVRGAINQIPTALRTEAEMRVVQQKLDDHARTAADLAPAEYIKSHQQLVQKLFAGKPPKNAKEQGVQRRVMEFMSEWEVVDAGTLIAATDQGAEAVEKAITAARKTAIPIGSSARRVGREASIRSGRMFTGDPVSDFRTVLKSMEPDDMLVLENEGKKMSGLLKAYGKNYEPLVPQMRGIASEIGRGFARTRELLGASGQFQATGEQLSETETAALAKYINTYAKAANLGPEVAMELFTLAAETLGPNNGIKRKPTPSEMLQQQTDFLLQRNNRRPLFNSGNSPTGNSPTGNSPVDNRSGYRPPADPNSPF